MDAFKSPTAASVLSAKLSNEVVGGGRESVGGGGRESRTTMMQVESSKMIPSVTTNLEEETALLGMIAEEEPALVESSDDDFSSDEEESEDEEEDEEYDAFLLERLLILRDAAALKTVASHFIHPEAPVVAAPECGGRNFFDRASAVEQLEADEAEEIAQSLADAAALKSSVAGFAHPEAGVQTEDVSAIARCFFDRPSAPAQLDADEAEEIAQSLADAAKLKAAAVDYSHPERPVTDAAEAHDLARGLAYLAAAEGLAVDYVNAELAATASSATAAGHNFFSSVHYEDEQVDADRDDILEDVARLTKVARDYLHPEVGVATADATIYGRNYFNRASAPDAEEDEIEAERDEVLEDVAELKKLAVSYFHPEAPVEVDATASARCFFDRASAFEQEDTTDAEDRAQALADAKVLKQSAVDYSHPERPVTDAAEARAIAYGLSAMAASMGLAVDYANVELDATASCAAARSRCFFDRASAVEQENLDEAEDRAMALVDAVQLKQSVVDYAHPEFPVTDAAEARAIAYGLSAMAASMGLAVDYASVELAATTSSATASGRNFFSRPAAEEYEEEDVDCDRDDVLADVAAFKKLAVDYAHPEAAVVSAPEVCGRNYFHRASAPATDEEDMNAERDDVAELKKLAVSFAHPEAPVEVNDTAATARCFFDRASAVQQEDSDEADARVSALEDAAKLKAAAIDYAHPERPVTDAAEARAVAYGLSAMAASLGLAVEYTSVELAATSSSATAAGRNFFSRPAAEEYEEEDVDCDRDDILDDVAAFKKLAVDYAHPEAPVSASPEVFARSYFNRASAPNTEKETMDAERDDVAELKKLAVAFGHPESKVEVDPAASARCFFDRASAVQQEDFDEAEERASALADAMRLKKTAVDYAHPEAGVVATSDPAAFGRNFFSRPAASEYEDEQVDADRDDILEDMAAFKKLATDYAHPEAAVVSSPEVFGRNFFDRASATEEDEMDAERDAVLEDVTVLKKLAVDFGHPEAKVEVGSTATARNFFSRASAPHTENLKDSTERAQALADALSFKRLATDYSHPEVGVTSSDPAAFGRNFFSRPAAAEYEEEDVDADRDDVLEDMAALKKLATDYAHPEAEVEMSGGAAFGRNYFNRASAPAMEEEDVDAERDEVLEDVAELKRFAANFSHPEAKIEVDAAAFGRNYFNRASVPQHDNSEEAEDRAAALADASRLQRLAKDYAHPEAGVETTDVNACGRNYFTRPSAPQSEDIECSSALADAASLKKLAQAYAHPEAPVDTSDPAASFRNYFSRYSSATHNDSLITTSNALKAGAAAAAPQQQASTKKSKASANDDGGQEMPRNMSSHMLFGMAGAN